MATLPTHLYTQKNPDAGTGLFVSEAIPPGVEILRVDRPLVSVLDSPHLKDACSECCLWLPENGDGGDSQSKRLRACQGCKITKYCCKVGLSLLCSMLLNEASITICSRQSCMSIVQGLSFVSFTSCMKSFGPYGAPSSVP